MDDDTGSTLLEPLTGFEETDQIEIEPPGPDAGLDVITDTGLLFPVAPDRGGTEGDWPPSPRHPGRGVSEFRT